MLQCVAVCFSALQCVATVPRFLLPPSTGTLYATTSIHDAQQLLYATRNNFYTLCATTTHYAQQLLCAITEYIKRLQPIPETMRFKCSSEWKSDGRIVVTGLFSKGGFQTKFEQRPYWIVIAAAICTWSKESRLKPKP